MMILHEVWCDIIAAQPRWSKLTCMDIQNYASMGLYIANNKYLFYCIHIHVIVLVNK